MNELGRKIDHLYRIIAGEELNEETSIVNRLRMTEKKVDELTKFRERVIYALYGAAIPALYGTGKFFETIIEILK